MQCVQMPHRISDHQCEEGLLNRQREMLEDDKHGVRISSQMIVHTIMNVIKRK